MIDAKQELYTHQEQTVLVPTRRDQTLTYHERFALRCYSVYMCVLTRGKGGLAAVQQDVPLRGGVESG